MKVTAIKFHSYHEAHARGCFVELITDTECVGTAFTSRDVGRVVGPIANELLIGEAPSAVASLWQRMSSACAAKRGDGSAPAAAIAVLDLALWDLKAKAQEEPVWRTLGGSRPRLNAYLSITDPALADDALDRRVRSMVKRYGVHNAKLALRDDMTIERDRLAMVRDGLSGGASAPELMIDAESRWTPKETIRRMRTLEREFDLTWVEGGAAESDFLGLARISRTVRAAVCGGRTLTWLAEYLPHFHHRALDVIAIDVELHGISGALQLADAAFAFELPVSLAASTGHVAAHLGGVLPYVMNIELASDALDATAAVQSDVRIEDGWAIVGDAPGLGVPAPNQRAIGAQAS